MPEAAEHIEQTPETMPTDEIMSELDAVFDAEHGNALPTEPPEKGTEPEPERELEEQEPEPLADEEPEQESSIDYDLSIPMPDGREAMTIGQMKDQVTKLERTEQQQIDRENDLMRQQQDIDSLMQGMGNIPPELQQQARAKQDAHLQREQAAMLKAMPEWNDRETYDRDRTAIVDVAQRYGFTETEVNQIMDHRAVKLIRDMARLSTKVEEAEKLPAQVRKQSGASGRKPRASTKKSNLDALVDTAISSSNDDVKQAAITELLRG